MIFFFFYVIDKFTSDKLFNTLIVIKLSFFPRENSEQDEQILLTNIEFLDLNDVEINFYSLIKFLPLIYILGFNLLLYYKSSAFLKYLC